MRSPALIIIFLLSFSSFGNSTSNFTPSDSTGLDSLWLELAFEKGGCLTGGQHVRNGEFGGEACVLTRNRSGDWRPFFRHSKKELTDFLINQFADTSETKIHTCPFFAATAGELAVYCLSKIYLVNWYDFEPFLEYKDRELTSSMDSPQTWLQAILEDPKQREVLIAEWRKL
jgi:hypothetical protein